jgi:hypothetical protein
MERNENINQSNQRRLNELREGFIELERTLARLQQSRKNYFVLQNRNVNLKNFQTTLKVPTTT